MAQRQKPVITNLIFDFDGTLADSLPAMIAVFNKRIRGDKNPLTYDEIERLRDMTSRQAIRNLGIRWWQIPKFLLQGMGDFHALVPTLKSFTGLPQTIQALHKNGYQLFIVTSNTDENVELFLKNNGLETYFSDMATGSGLFRKAKHIRRLMKKHGLKRRSTVYIGDETRDIAAARLSFIKGISVTWGFNTKCILARQRPSYIIDKPKELIDIVNSSVALT
ncbi:MAG: HAD-IA family hydrolase [bacterium]|nr:HAD-IA family hydrolase [bacterium]